MSKGSISNSVIRRLPRYYRFLGELEKDGYIRISSRELAEKMGLTASQIRQDFNCFGEFGQQGYGYNVSELKAEVGDILGIKRKSPMILLGAGNLGRAIAAHVDFESKGFSLIGVFDTNTQIIGSKIGKTVIRDFNDIEEFCEENKPVAAVLCVPAEITHDVAEKLVKFGIKAFWSFSHFDLKLDYDDVVVENVHLGDSLTILSYKLNHCDDM